MDPPGLADDPHFALEFDAKLLTHRLLRKQYQGFNIGGRCAARIHDEIGVLRRYHRATPHCTFEAACFYEPRGVITRRVTKDRARIWLG